MKEASARSGRLSLGEEIANSITHGVGALLSIAGLVTLIVLADNTNRVSFIVYGVTLVLLYLASTLYHSLIFTRARVLFRKFDHMVIFLLIAGTYTLFCLMAVRGWVGWTVLGII